MRRTVIQHTGIWCSFVTLLVASCNHCGDADCHNFYKIILTEESDGGVPDGSYDITLFDGDSGDQLATLQLETTHTGDNASDNNFDLRQNHAGNLIIEYGYPLRGIPQFSKLTVRVVSTEQTYEEETFEPNWIEQSR